MIKFRLEQPEDTAGMRQVNEAAFGRPNANLVGALRQAGHDLLIVLGHPDYYPRIGFVPASRHGAIRWGEGYHGYCQVPARVYGRLTHIQIGF